MLNKQSYTRELIKQLPEAPDLDQAMRTWWANIRESGGLRLTEIGLDAFELLELERWSFDVKAHTFTKPNVLLALDKRLTCPYYIQLGRYPKLIMFGSREAMTLALYGDIEKFIISLSRQ